MGGHSSPGPGPERYRLFIAIPLPDAIKQSIEKAQHELRSALPADSIRWTRIAHFHLTLRFLGSVEPSRVEALTDAVRRACSGFGDLQLRAAGIGVFPGPRRPRVVWTGVRDTRERLAVLQRAIEAATSEFTVEPPQETFTGHITLARCRDVSRGESAALAGLVERMASRSFGAWTADRIDVIRSEPTPNGSRYTTLATAPLGEHSIRQNAGA